MLAFLALALFGVPFPVVVAVGRAGRLGAGPVAARRRCRTRATAEAADDGPPPVISDDVLHTELPSTRRTLRVLLVGLLVWGVPVAAVALLTGTDSVFTQQGLFFSGAAVVTFGGAYAVLAYVAQQAVQVYGWLAPGEMVRGLALAETTPGSADHGRAVRGVPRRLPGTRATSTRGWPPSSPRCWSPG